MRLRHIGGVHTEVISLIRSIGEVGTPAPEIVPVVLVLIRIIVLEIPEHGLYADVQPWGGAGVDRSRDIVFFDVVGIQFKNAAVIAVASGQVVRYLIAAAGYAEVMLLREGILIQHFFFGVPNTVK